MRGNIHAPKRKADAHLIFDDAHINSQRRHGVTVAETRSYIENAAVSATKWNGRFEDYHGYEGAAYVDAQKNEICTAFSREQFDPIVKANMEVLEKNGL